MSRNSTTLWSPNDTVRDAAEVLGVSDLPEDVAKAVAMDVEYRIHEVVEQALKFMRHSKRRTLATRDIAAALRVLNVEPLYGYDAPRPAKFHEALAGSGQTLYYLDEEDEVDFDRLIAEPIPKVPREPTFTAHWLAIEGVQPAIPQNPHLGEIRQLAPAVRGAQVTYATTKLGQDAEVKPLVKHMISKELQLYFDRIFEALLRGNTKEAKEKVSEDSNQKATEDNKMEVEETEESGKTEGSGKTEESDKTEQSEKSEKAVEKVEEKSEYATALYSLRNDPGLHQLTPYFVQFVQEKLSSGLKGPPEVIDTMLAVIEALLANPTVYVGPYIHQIVPAVLTVLVAKRITNGGFPQRALAASLLRKIVAEFGGQYTQLRSRLTRTLLKGFMDIKRPLESLCGIVEGIAALGPEVVLVVIVGNLDAWLDPVVARAHESGNEDGWVHLKNTLADALAMVPEAKDALKKLNESDA